MTKRIMQLQVLNRHASVFVVEAGKRNHFAAELARAQRENAPLAARSRLSEGNGGPEMTRWRTLGAALIAATAAAVATGTAGAVTPIDGGDAGGTPTTLNNGPGDQSEPHVSGNLAVYTGRADIFSPGTIHYFDFSTSSDGVVPAGAPGDSDVLSDVNGNRIVFSRTRSRRRRHCRDALRRDDAAS